MTVAVFRVLPALRLAIVLGCLASPQLARADPVRILIAAGASTGLSYDRPLSHPRNDATAVRDVFTQLGWVSADHAIFLPDTSKGAFLAAFERARAIAARHVPGEVTFVVYFSGHGDREALHLRGESFAIADLSARIAQVPAALRIVVIDACRTTEALRAKGMSVRPGFSVQLPAQPAATGSVWVYASTDGEAAQESDEIGGALFTHFWLSGLRGGADTNGDARVTLEEAFAYAYHQTLLRSARSGGVLQRPEVKLDLREAGPLVLTEIAGPRAQLEFPRDPDSLYLVYAAGSQSIVAEVYGASERATRIALPKGRYVIQKRSGTRGAAAELTLVPGAVRVLTASDFRPHASEALAQKGAMVVRPWSLALGDGVFRGTQADFANELFLRIERRDSNWGYAFAPIGGFAIDKTAFNDVREWSVGGELSIDRFFPLGAPTLLRLGIDLRGEWIWQTLDRNDADRIALAGYRARSQSDGSAWGGGLHAALRFSMSPRLYLDVGVRALALGAKTESGVEGRLLGGGFVAFGAAL